MESVKFVLLFLCFAGILFCSITITVNVLYLVIGTLYDLVSRPKCPNCTKRVGKETIRCPHCRSSLGEKQPQEEIDPELYTRVKALIAEQTWVSEEELTPDTHLAEDLGIAGDDGYELLEAFCETFEIENMSEIEPYDYFGPEALDPFYVYVFLYYWVFNREKLNEPYYSLMPLYLRDLVKSAEAKRWIPPGATE